MNEDGNQSSMRWSSTPSRQAARSRLATNSPIRPPALSYSERRQRQRETTQATEPIIQVRRMPFEVLATEKFRKDFLRQEYGVVCNVCERLWFKNNTTPATANHQAILEQLGIPLGDCHLCATCSTSIKNNRIPSLAAHNGFRYPPKPEGLPPLNLICKRLISPRIPYMQIRRLRRETATYIIVGQIINVPVDL